MSKNRDSRMWGNISRRDILRYSLAGAGIYALGPMKNLALAAPAPPSGQPFMVVCNLFGGSDFLNIVPPITGSAATSYANKRSSIGISPGAALSLTGGPNVSEVGLHPTMTNFQSIWNDSELAIVQKVGYPGANGSHFTSQDIYSTGITSILNAEGSSGWIARYLKEVDSSMFGGVYIGSGSIKDFKGVDGVNPFMASSLSNYQYLSDISSYTGDHAKRLSVISDILNQYDDSNLYKTGAKEALEQGHANEAFVQGAESGYTDPGGYPNNSIGRAFKDCAKLIQAGVSTEIFYVGQGGHDTHGNQGGATGNHANLMNDIDNSIGAFVQNMKNLGQWNNCVIVVISEFGRRNFENGSGGTDHGTGAHMYLLGGNVTGGLYGGLMTASDIDDNDNMPISTDFRHVYWNVLANHLNYSNPGNIFTDTNFVSGSSVLNIL